MSSNRISPSQNLDHVFEQQRRDQFFFRGPSDKSPAVISGSQEIGREVQVSLAKANSELGSQIEQAFAAALEIASTKGVNQTALLKALDIFKSHVLRELGIPKQADQSKVIEDPESKLKALLERLDRSRESIDQLLADWKEVTLPIQKLSEGSVSSKILSDGFFIGSISLISN